LLALAYPLGQIPTSLPTAKTPILARRMVGEIDWFATFLIAYHFCCPDFDLGFALGFFFGGLSSGLSSRMTS